MAKEKKHKEFWEFPKKSKYNKLRSLKDKGLESAVNVWYKKLAASGFNDIESTGRTKRHGNEVFFQPNDLPPRRSDNSKAKQRFYNAWSCFFAHNEHLINCKRVHLIIKEYSEGATLTAISQKLKKGKFKKPLSVTAVGVEVNEWSEAIMIWNTIHPNGEFYIPPSNVLKKL